MTWLIDYANAIRRIDGTPKSTFVLVPREWDANVTFVVQVEEQMASYTTLQASNPHVGIIFLILGPVISEPNVE